MQKQPHLMDLDPEEQLSEEEKAKKAEYRQRLADKLKDPEFRNTDGFPIGDDEAILALSDPPFYTACPNPFLLETMKEWQAERASTRKELGFSYDKSQADYLREPFATDVREGKNHAIYNAHSYHTKVPHRAIMRYILHYTEPGDIIYDGFCGTGMTGVAAQMCALKSEVEALGYLVDDDGAIFKKESQGQDNIEWKPFSHLGSRKTLLIDISPAATFISYILNSPIRGERFTQEAKKLLHQLENEYGWMYETKHDNAFAFWSVVFIRNTLNPN